MTSTRKLLLDGLQLPECPRWREGRLWFSDMFRKRVSTVDLQGRVQLVAEFEDRPSGIGFLPDGTPIVVQMTQRRLLRLDPGGPRLHADLAVLGGNHLNDMVIDARGRAYVGLRMQPRSVAPADEARDATDRIVRIESDGKFEIAAEGLITPNGMAITGDGSRLVVAETRAARLRSFSLSPAGELRNPIEITRLKEGLPDGICVDREDAVWVAALTAHCFLRISPGGECLQRIDLGNRLAMACTLGGPERKTLFMMTTEGNLEGFGPQQSTEGGFIETAVVHVPGAGLP